MEGARSSAHQPLLRQKQPKPGPQWSASSRQGSQKLYKYRNAQIHTYANTLLHRYTYKQQIQKNALSPVVGKCIHYVIQPRVLEFVIFLLEWKKQITILCCSSNQKLFKSCSVQGFLWKHHGQKMEKWKT